MTVEIEEREDVSVVDNGASTKKETPRKPTKPPRYKVVFHNDDFTPMEFVIWALMTYFGKNEVDATSIMAEVHQKGKGIAGVYDFQIAEMKIYETMMSAKEHEYPLLVNGELDE